MTLIKLSRLAGLSFKSWKHDYNSFFIKFIHLPHTRFEGTVNSVNYIYQSGSVSEIQVSLFFQFLQKLLVYIWSIHQQLNHFCHVKRPSGLHEHNPVYVRGWYVLKTWSSNSYLQLDCSPYSKIEGRCPFQMSVLLHLVTHQMI